MTEKWFAVRCVFRHGGLEAIEDAERSVYEERVTLWRAPSADAAISLAEAEAVEYSRVLAPNEYLGLAQSYELARSPEHGAEIFSLLRESDLDADAYIDRFFDTGDERQTIAGEKEIG